MGARKLSYNTLYCIRSYKEVSGSGNSYTTQFIQYDPRLGRWKSLDPLAGKFPNQSPFCAFNNNPLYFTDPLGLEGEGPGDKPSKKKANSNPDAWEFDPDKADGSYEIKIDEKGNEIVFKKENGTWEYQATVLKSVEVTVSKNENKQSTTTAPTQKSNGKIIFVNGYLGFGSPEGGEDYWNQEFVEGAEDFFNTNNNSYFTDIDYSLETTSFDRTVAGYTYAKNNFEELTKGLDKKTDGIYLVSHSMGGAFAYGMELYFISNGWSVKTSVFLNTYQAMTMNVSHKYDGKVMHVEYRNPNDPVITYLGDYGKINGNIDLRIEYEVPNSSLFRIHKYPIIQGEQFWIDLKNGNNGTYNYSKSILELYK